MALELAVRRAARGGARRGDDRRRGRVHDRPRVRGRRRGSVRDGDAVPRAGDRGRRGDGRTVRSSSRCSARREARSRCASVLRVVRRDELVLAGIAIIVLIGLVGGGVNLLVPLQLKANGVSAGEIGLLFSVASAVYTVVSAIVARLGERSATLRVGGIAALLTGLTIVLVLSSTSTVAAVAFVLLRAPPWSTMDTIIYPLAAAGAHRSALGRGSVMGLVMLGWAAASTVGPLLAGRDRGRGERARGVRGHDRVLRGSAGSGCFGPVGERRRLTRRSTSTACTARAISTRFAPSTTGSRRAYDAELVDGMGYRSPDAVAAVAQKLLAGRRTNPRCRCRNRPARRRRSPRPASRGWTASTSRLAMLAEAARKGVYSDLREGTTWRAARLTRRRAYDGVVSAGVLTAGHAPASQSRRARPDHPPGRPHHLHASVRSGAAGLRRRRSLSSRARAAGSSSSEARSSRRCRKASQRWSCECGRFAFSSRQVGRSAQRALLERGSGARGGERRLEARRVGEQLLRVRRPAGRRARRRRGRAPRSVPRS